MPLGICGGLQMLGEALVDLHGIDGNAPGLGLLPLVTQFEVDKSVRHTRTTFTAEVATPRARLVSDSRHGHGDVANPWAALAGMSFSGYEIHQGQTRQHPGLAQAGDVATAVLPNALGWQNAAGNVLGVYLHGLFEDAAVRQAWMTYLRPWPTLSGSISSPARWPPCWPTRLPWRLTDDSSQTAQPVPSID